MDIVNQTARVRVFRWRRGWPAEMTRRNRRRTERCHTIDDQSVPTAARIHSPMSAGRPALDYGRTSIIENSASTSTMTLSCRHGRRRRRPLPVNVRSRRMRHRALRRRAAPCGAARRRTHTATHRA